MDANTELAKVKSRELKNAENLMNEGKFDEALSILNGIEKEILNDADHLTFCLIKSSLLEKLGKNKESYSFAEQAYQESQKLNNSLLSIDALNLKAATLLWRGGVHKALDNAYELVERSEELLKSFKRESPVEVQRKEALIYYVKAVIFWFKGNINQAIEYGMKSLALREKIGIKHEIAESLLIIGAGYSFSKSDLVTALYYANRCQVLAEEINYHKVISWNQVNLGIIYGLKGEFEKSLNYSEQALSFFEKIDDKGWTSATLNNISEIYFEKGDFDKASEYLQKSLGIMRKIGSKWMTSHILHGIVSLNVIKGNTELAQESLEELKEINDQTDNKTIKYIYLLSKAIILKSSSRIHDRAKAENIFKQIIQGEIIKTEIPIDALINMCELLLDEMKLTNNFEILDELEPYITQLLDIAEKSNSFWVLAETYTLQAKLSLLTSDLKKARQLLTKAQQIAEKQGISRLAAKISIEHDNLLRELNKWEMVNEGDIPLNERMQLAQIDNQMKNLLWDRDLSYIKYSDEESILLLVLTEGGMPIFSQIFTKDWTYEDHLVGGFLSAINSFSSELFSKGLDRAKFGDHTVIMKSFENFLVCYLFKGQSYPAINRINTLVEHINNSNEIKETFKKFYRNQQIIELEKYPLLKSILTDIFIHKIK